MKFTAKLRTGTLVERPNRFLALVRLHGSLVKCFCPNPGRLRELLIPGARVLVSEEKKPDRKTMFDLAAAKEKDTIVWIDTRIPNSLVADALKRRYLPEFRSYSVIVPEYRYGNSRLDFLLAKGSRKCLLEVKSVTLVNDGIALFPDAPTLRGSRHMQELAKAAKRKIRACVLFVIQRSDAQAFAPNDSADYRFATALRKAAAEGVEIYAYKVKTVGRYQLSIDCKVPIKL